jgi:hypothetical protein
MVASRRAAPQVDLKTRRVRSLRPQPKHNLNRRRLKPCILSVQCSPRKRSRLTWPGLLCSRIASAIPRAKTLTLVSGVARQLGFWADGGKIQVTSRSWVYAYLAVLSEIVAMLAVRTTESTRASLPHFCCSHLHLPKINIHLDITI